LIISILESLLKEVWKWWKLQEVSKKHQILCDGESVQWKNWKSVESWFESAIRNVEEEIKIDCFDIVWVQICDAWFMRDCIQK
jgi:hypothetical protein